MFGACVNLRLVLWWFAVVYFDLFENFSGFRVRFSCPVFAAKRTIPIAAPPDAAAPGVGFFVRLPNKFRA